jgi:hypothetical protein
MSLHLQDKIEEQGKLEEVMVSSNEENNCGICLNSLNNKKFGLKKIIHKCDKEVCEWKHEFHIKCINDWIHMCVNTGEGTYPKCPTCGNFDIPIDKIPEKLKSRAQSIMEANLPKVHAPAPAPAPIIVELEELEFRIARRRLFDILLRHVTDQFLPFIGVIICVNGEPVVKDISTNLRINIRQKMGDLKNAILEKNIVISKKIGLLNPVKFRLKYWTDSSYPTFRAEDIHYCIPPYTRRFAQMETAYDLNSDDTLLSDVYLDCQYKMSKIYNSEPGLINSVETPNAYQHLKNIYLEQNLMWNESTGPDDPGRYDTAFSNPQNCDIPQNCRPYRYDPKSTIDSISWLIFNLVAEDM